MPRSRHVVAYGLAQNLIVLDDQNPHGFPLEASVAQSADTNLNGNPTGLKVAGGSPS
jgi:hypothetical protein